MSKHEFQLHCIGDPRLAAHATSALPVWLWSTDGSQVFWANPVGARLFGAANSAALARTTFGPADAQRRQVAQLAGRLPPDGAIRLERLRGFGAVMGRLMTCSCARLVFPDGSHGILIAAMETSGQPMPLIERLQRLVEGVETPVVVFARDGLFVGASDAARSLLGFPDLSAAGLDAARHDAIQNGRVELPIGSGHMVLQRVGTGSDIGLVALIAPGTEAAARPPTRAAKRPEPRQPVARDETIAPAATAAPLPLQPAETSQSPTAHRRRHPLRFIWQMDAEEHFSFGADEFTRLIGPGVAAGFGRQWREIAEAFGLDPSGRVAEAIATRQRWSDVTVYWPVEGGGRLPVELSGLPIYDEERNFLGYRGFGVCRVLDTLAYLEDLRGVAPTDAPPASPIHSADIIPTDFGHAAAAEPPAESPALSSAPPEKRDSIADDAAPRANLDELVEMHENVVPFRPLGEPRSPALTPVENNAFDELARQLSARLDRDYGGMPPSEPSQPEWLSQPEPPPRGESARDRALLDLLPSGVLIYRFDRLLYANPAFLQRIGYDSLHALEHAGGLDALYVAPGVSSTSSTSESGTPVTISASQETFESSFEASSGPSPSTDARLFTISWDGDPAHALMFSPDQAVAGAGGAPTEIAANEPAPQPTAETAPASPRPAAGQATSEQATSEQVTSEQATPEQAGSEDLAAILDTVAQGIVMFDAEGNICACNRSAEALFGYEGSEFLQRNLADLFAPESQRVVGEYLESIRNAGGESLFDHGRDVLARVKRGGIIPLSMTMGRTRLDGSNFFVVFRDISESRRSESEPQQARRSTDRTTNTGADMLTRISQEVGAPLHAILAFTEAMMGERSGSLGSERYLEYARDIRASGERMISVINDLLELSRIQTGGLDLAFADQNLNEMVESCVSVMQPQANRERIIIRTSLAQALPPVVADGRALRQITLNLIGNSIHLANPAGQVIVSTALSDVGDVVLRVRDTGHGLNDNEIAAALEPFRNPSPDQAADSAAVNLSLTKALVEANRARFHIKPGGRSGTLIEVVFPRAAARG
jgi:PAS domain S-box-containing protein